MTDKTPITLLTGFLGSGKSTLLSQILTDPAFANTAVIVNEFGEVGLDDFLVTHSEEQVVQMTTGCLCCTIRGDISNTLLDLSEKRETGELPNFERIVVETTGLADPAPVIQTIATDPRLVKRYALCGVVTTVDGVNGMATLDRQKECVKQVAIADRLVLTKTDLDVAPTDLSTLRQRLERLNPTAVMLEKKSPAFKLAKLFDTALFDETSKSPDVQKWLSVEKLDHDHALHHHEHHLGHHHHDINRHGDDIEAFSLIYDEPLSTQSFFFGTQVLVKDYGQDLLRIKGVVCFQERPENPYIFHAVQHVFHDPVKLDQWPTDDHRSKIVFVTRGISKSTIEDFFDSWLKKK